MASLKSIEIKAFVPAKDFALSQRFYQDIGFTKASEGGGVAYFYHRESSFLLQDFYLAEHAQNCMMHLLVHNAAAWHVRLVETRIPERYGVQLTALTTQPWGMRDFALSDPSGVVWRIAENLT